MSSSANEKTTEVGCVVEHDAHGDVNKSAMTPGENANDDKNEEEEEDEEEDVDFNPFLKETPSPEASSSLSSEIVGDSEHGEEEITAQTTVSPEGGCEKENEHRKDVLRKTKKTKSVSMSQSKAETVREKENGSTSSGIEVNEGMLGELSNTTHSWKPITHLDDEDAICRRTRARYSLASFKLDELEAFLQETDDEDDLQNVDDEEEYRKFLAAVLQGGDCDGQSIQENENMDDEDEDNDADFEIELEEMLESDYDEGTIEKTQKQEVVRARRRPETRQNRRQRASVQYKNKLLEQAKRPLRPLLPILPCGQPVASFPIIEGKTFTLETAPRCLSSTAEDALINGFSPHQIGQLHCLIHEHVQLLIQIFSLCILDPSRQHIASQVQGLIFEMLHKRDEVIACRSEPYPDSYFHPPYICSSVPDALPKIYPEQSASGPSSIQTVEVSFWVPSICGSVLSVMDVAPLNLVGKYMDDVYTAVREYRQRRVESSSDVLFEREPLFPFLSFPSLVEANGEVSKGRNLPPANTVPSSLSPQPSKKSLAAALVESTKKQSVALVPKEISKLAQRFFSNFNPALFPHKPPPTAVANRVLFTDAEDELLALGMIEYNTDWKAIQQRFLPSKTKHQIFVRQKNRCSSKAPENSIKVVRRMKTSPLTAKEIECIQEGLKMFKLDWMSVWKFVVPHRDPTLLRRQWRIALGTQKSYKQDAAKKEKRRMYELKRRCKTADLANWHLDSDKEGENIGRENNSADDYVENADECYVHEGFLADWRPGVTDHGPSVRPCLNLGEKHVTYDTLSREDTHIRGNPNNNGSGEAQNPSSSSMHEFPYSINNSQHPYPLSNFTGVRHGLSNTSQPNHIVSDMASKTYKSQVCLPPYRARRTNNAHLVKLAPDLPPVNLPPSVRIISQSAFRSDQSGASKKVSANGGRTGDFRQENIVPHVAQSGTPHSIKTGKDIRNPGEENVTNLNSEESHLVKDKCVEEERCSESDLQMHPLLFQAPEDGRLPYYPLNCSTNMSSSFSFFSGNQPQLNLSLFHNPHQVNRAVDCFNKFLKTKESKASCGIDFHPLLTRTEDANTDSMTAPSVGCPSVGLEGNSDQRQNSSVAVLKKSLVSGSPLTTGSLHSSSNERANELDLEIHLSSRSAKDRASGSGDVITHNSMQPTVGAANSADKTEYQDTNNIYCNYGTNCSNVVSDAHVSVMTSTSNIGDTDEHSHPEIVMEQEELSDSDEEIEEDVEFECEEMADSEGEVGSCSEQIAEMQDKEIPSPVTEKVVTDGDSDDQQQYELRTPSCAQANVCDPTMGTPPFLKLGLTNLGKEHTSISWLSLNSCAPGRPTRKKSKNEEHLMSEDPAAKNLASCRPSRSCKTPTHSTKKIAAQKPATDMAEQLSLGPLAIRSVRKPRKRPCRSSTSLNIGMTSETPKVDDKDELG